MVGSKHAATGVCTNYTIFKETLEFEEYLITLDFKYMKNLCKFRCRSHNLPVNNGRFIEVTQADLNVRCAKVVMLVMNIIICVCVPTLMLSVPSLLTMG